MVDLKGEENQFITKSLMKTKIPVIMKSKIIPELNADPKKIKSLLEISLTKI